MTTTVVKSNWSGLESVEFGEYQYIQLAFRFTSNGFREYWVQWGFSEEDQHSEMYYSEDDDNKRLAYSLYWEKLEELLVQFG
jgi:hypothetical protein